MNRTIDDKQFSQIISHLAVAKGAFEGLCFHFETKEEKVTRDACQIMADKLSVFIDKLIDERCKEEEC